MPFTSIVGKAITAFSNLAVPAMGVAALGLLVWVYQEEGIAGVWTTLRVDVLKLSAKFVWVCLIFFVIAGTINHQAKKHQKEFGDTLAGKNGMIRMIILATVMPGPAGGQQLQEEWKNPTTDKTKVLVCLCAMMSLGITIFIFRGKVLGPQLTMIWIGMAWVFLIEVWAVTKAWTMFFSTV